MKSPQVTKDTPPTFLFHTKEDKAVPLKNSELFYDALKKAGVEGQAVHRGEGAARRWAGSEAEGAVEVAGGTGSLDERAGSVDQEVSRPAQHMGDSRSSTGKKFHP